MSPTKDLFTIKGQGMEMDGIHALVDTYPLFDQMILAFT
jgi:hypothetical protein